LKLPKETKDNDIGKWIQQAFFAVVALMLIWRIIMDFNVIRRPVEAVFSVIWPFVAGFILAYILNIPAGGVRRRLEKSQSRYAQRFAKAAGIVCAYLMMLGLIVLALRLVFPAIEEGVNFFVANSAAFYTRIQNYAEYINDLDLLGFEISADGIVSQIRNFSIDSLILSLESSISAITSASSMLLKSFIAFISSIYILIEKDKFRAQIKRFLKAVLPEHVYYLTDKYTGRLNQNFKQYLYTQTLDGVILTLIVVVELYLLGSPYAMLLGVMIGVVNYIPYFGAITGSAVAVVVTIFTQGFPIGLLTALVLLITQQFDGNVLQPRLMGDSFALSPLMVIVSVTVGGAAAGILGMLLAIPIVAVLRDMLNDFLIYMEQKKTATAPEEPVLEIPADGEINKERIE
jgi:Predicted permease